MEMLPVIPLPSQFAETLPVKVMLSGIITDCSSPWVTSSFCRILCNSLESTVFGLTVRFGSVVEGMVTLIGFCPSATVIVF